MFIAQGKLGEAFPVHQLSPNVNPLDTAKRQAAADFTFQNRFQFETKVCQKSGRGPRSAVFCFSLGFGTVCAANVLLPRVWGRLRRELRPNAGERSCCVAALLLLSNCVFSSKVKSVSENPSGFLLRSAVCFARVWGGLRRGFASFDFRAVCFGVFLGCRAVCAADLLLGFRTFCGVGVPSGLERCAPRICFCGFRCGELWRDLSSQLRREL